MKAPITSNTQVNIMLILFLLVLLVPYSMMAQNRKTVFNFRGFEAGFGVRTFSLESDIPELNGLRVIEEGGSAGVVWGNDVVRTRLNAGFFYSASSVRHTVDQFQTNARVNFYPLSLTGRVAPKFEFYLAGGAGYDKFNFAGSYLDKDAVRRNYSNPSDSYIGNIQQVQLNGGIGFEYKINRKIDFLHIFSEAIYASPISTSSIDTFKGTRVMEQTRFTVGVRFGAIKK